MFKKSNLIIILSLLMLLAIPVTFAADNQTLDELSYSVNDADILKDTGYYYFNASVGEDGNGSIDNPYKYLTDDRVGDNSVLYFADGEYEFNPSNSHSNITVYGESVRTVIKGSGNNLIVKNCFTLENITFINTQIFNQGTLSASNVLFANSTAKEMDSYGNSYGGAIYCTSSSHNIYLKNCTFENTYAEYGGAIYINGGILNINNSNFINTTSYNYGGAIVCLNSKNISISKSKFNKSVSINDAAGAIYVISSALTANDVDFINCNASFGGAVASLKSNLALNDINVVNSFANWYGGAVYHMYGNVSISNSSFSNNRARNGAALFIDNSTSLTIINNNFSNNNASICAGAIYSIFNSLKSSIYENNQFKDNFAFMYDDVYDSSSLNLNVGNGNYTMYKYNSTGIAELPSYYSLIDEGQITAVKDQQSGGSCWAFAGIAVLESAILKASGETLDLSEENMKNLMAKYSDYGWDMETNAGGYMNMIYGYLASWLGPVNDSDDRYDDKSHISQIMNSIAHVQNILFLKRNNYTDNDAIKEALMKYGAVGTSMHMGGTIRNNAFYYTGSDNSNHAVTIVGWDDNFSKDNFASKPAGNGAWIVKNSWGPNWVGTGYFYVSYYDTRFAQPGVNEIIFTVILNDTIRFDKNYQYDIAGKTDYFVNSSNNVWYKNIFNATDNEYLAAVSTYFDKIYNYTVSVYLNGELKLEQSGISQVGYYTIALNKMIQLNTGDTFEVMFKLSSEGEAYFPISEDVSLNRLTYAPGISYVSYNGENWFDLYDLVWKYSSHWYTSQVACIKAFTYLNEIKTFLDLNVDFDSFNTANITAKVVDEYGNLLNNAVVKFIINGKTYNSDVINGIAKLYHVFNSTQNTIISLFEKIGYISSDNSTQFTLPKQKINLDFNISRFANNVTIGFINPQNADVNVTLNINGRYYTVNSKESLKLTGLANDIYEVNASLSDLSVYEIDETTSSFVVDVKDTQIVAGDLIFTDDDFVDFNITLTDENGIPLSNKSIIFEIDGKTDSVKTNTYGSASIPLHLVSGDYVIKTIFNGDTDYFKSGVSNSLKVKTNVSMDLSVNRYANNVSLAISISKSINDTLNVIVNSKSYNVDAKNGLASLDLTNLDNDVYAVNIYLNENYYVFNAVNSQVVVNVKNTHIEAGDLVFADDAFVDFNITLTDENGLPLSNRSIIFEIDGKSVSVKTDVNGIASIPLHLGSGEYIIKTLFDGDTDYFKSGVNNSLKVKTNVYMDLSVSRYANNVSLDITMSKAINDVVTVSVNSKVYSVNVKNGLASLDLVNLDNDVYDVNVYLDENYYVFNAVNSQVVVNVKDTRIEAGDLVFADDAFVDFNITLTDENGLPLSNKSIIFEIDGKTVSVKTDVNGIASIPLHLGSGEYIIKTLFDGDTDYFKSDVNNSLKVKTNVSMDLNMNKYANNVSVVINMSKAINDVVTVSVNSKVYSVNVKNGLASLDLTNLDNDVYDVNVYLDENYYVFNAVNSQVVVNVKDTRIEAGDLVFADDDFVDFNITLTDENGLPLSNKSIIFEIDGKSVSVKTDVNGIASIPLHLGSGEYIIKTLFDGDTDYFKSDVNNSLKVKNNVSMDLNVNKYANNVSVVINISKPVNDVVTVSVNSKVYSVNVKNGLASLDLVNLDNDVYDVNVYLDENYYVFNAVNSQVVVNVKDTRIEAEDLVFTDDDYVDFNITLTDENGLPLSNKSIIFEIDGKTVSVKTDVNGIASIPLHLGSGEYIIKTLFDGDTDYFKSDVSNFLKVKTNVSMDLNMNRYANNVSVVINMSKPVNDVVTVNVNDKIYNISVSDGLAVLKLSDLENDVYKIRVYLDEDNYVFNNIKEEFKIDVRQSMIISSDIVAVEGNVLYFDATLTDLNKNPICDAALTVSLNDNTFTLKTDINGNAVKELVLNPDEYEAFIFFAGDDSYFKSDSTSKIKVKTNTTLTLKSDIIQNNSKLTIISSKKINDTLIFKINDNVTYININGNVSQFSLSNLSNGIYAVEVSLTNNDDYVFNTIKDNFKIDVNHTNIISSDLTTYYGSNANYSITLKDIGGKVCANQIIEFKLANDTYYVTTDSKGQASINICLSVGEYLIEINYFGDNNHFKSSSTNKIIVKTSIVATDSLIKTYNSQYGVKFLDGNGKALKNTKISFVLDNVKYVESTDNNGYAYLKITETPGSYILNITNLNTGEEISQTINIVSRITQNKDMTIYAFSGKVYKILILDDNGNPVGAKEKVAIKIAGKTYTVKTDKNGYASLKISLVNKKYTITATYNGFKVSNKITVKPVVITSNKAYKKAKSYKFQAKLVNGNGKALKNKKITFKIKGKKYTAKTNKNGIAKITIKLSLKVGSYKIYSIYGKSKITNTIKIKK